MGVGLDNIAVGAATARGVWVTNVPDYCVEEVSDHAVAFALAWARGLLKFDRQVRSGVWSPAGARLRRLGSMTCGIVGMGKIGSATARKLAGFGCRLIAHTRSSRPTVPGVDYMDLDGLLGESDIVIIHLPLTPDTRHLFNGRRLKRMKQQSLLINVSRGAIVETHALLAALASGQLSAVGLDVLEGEPTVPAALVEHPESLLTPHIAFSSDSSVLELRRRAAAEVVRVLSGSAPLCPCNAPVFS